MTGVQTCALPICFPVTIAKPVKDDKKSQKEEVKRLNLLLDRMRDENKLLSESNKQLSTQSNQLKRENEGLNNKIQTLTHESEEIRKNVLLRIYYALKRKIKHMSRVIVNHIKLILIGICIVGLVALLSGCASAPICPELKVTFCPTE